MSRVFLLLVFAVAVRSSWSPYPERPLNNPKNSDEPLILTPLIESGKIAEARKLALVPPLLPGVTSYAGFLTVDAECGSNMFFWFFPSDSNYESSPLSVWLQGGPGASSLYGLFNENGPMLLTRSGKLKQRKFSWTVASSYLYIDNPVGTGFSYAKSTDCYSSNETHVGQNLLIALKQFLALFPELQKAPLFITGESYAGKYVPAFAYAIHLDNQDTSRLINLTGVAIGNGLVDPANQLHYGDYLYQIGLIDSTARDVFHAQEELGRSYIQAQDWSNAFKIFDTLLNGDITSEPSFFQNCSGFKYYFNYLSAVPPTEGDESAFVNSSEVSSQCDTCRKPALSNWRRCGENPEKRYDAVGRAWLETLLDHYRVLIYNGQLDIIVAYPLTVAYLQKLKWSAADDYKKASRNIWYVGKDIAGYVKTAGRLTEVLVRKAGHMVPKDQPRWALDLITRFVNDQTFPNKPW